MRTSRHASHPAGRATTGSPGTPGTRRGPPRRPCRPRFDGPPSGKPPPNPVNSAMDPDWRAPDASGRRPLGFVLPSTVPNLCELSTLDVEYGPRHHVICCRGRFDGHHPRASDLRHSHQPSTNTPTNARKRKQNPYEKRYETPCGSGRVGRPSARRSGTSCRSAGVLLTARKVLLTPWTSRSQCEPTRAEGAGIGHLVQPRARRLSERGSPPASANCRSAMPSC